MSEKKKPPEQASDEVDEASIESFPASDAPSFTPVTHAGRPSHERQEEKDEAKREKGKG